MYTLREAQQKTGRAERTLRRYIHDNKIQATQRGNKYFLDESTVSRLVKKGYSDPTATVESPLKTVQSSTDPMSLFPASALDNLYSQRRALEVTEPDGKKRLFQYAPQNETIVMQEVLGGGLTILAIVFIAGLLWLAYKHKDALNDIWGKITSAVPTMSDTESYEDIEATIASLPITKAIKVQQIVSDPYVLEQLRNIA
jgi:hypothetical protein